jgi:hypothetical protein
MKEIVIISDYPTDTFRTDNLFNLINNIKLKGKEILLMSHILIPDYITSRCDYYMFDKKNEIIVSNYNNLNADYCININNSLFCSKEFSRTNQNDYRYSIIKQFILSLNFLQMLKYDIIHYIEGDSNYNDLSEIDDNYNILTTTEYDSVIYHSQKMMCGSFFSFNLKKVNLENLLPLNKDNIVTNINIYKYAEEFTKKEILKDLVFLKKESDVVKYPILITCSNNESKNIWSSFFKQNNNWVYVMYNITNEDKKIKIYNNFSSNLTEFILFSGGNWRILPIETINDNHFFDVYVNDTLFKQYKLNSDMLEFTDNIITQL